MRELTLDAFGYNITPALDLALRAALPGKVIGVSTYGPARSISIFLDDSATGGDETTALATATAHDPVFLSASKAVLLANGVDSATITVNAPKPGAAPVTLQYFAGGVLFGEQLITLVAGVGVDTITALDPSVITVSVKTPANRSTDSLTIKAS